MIINIEDQDSLSICLSFLFIGSSIWLGFELTFLAARGRLNLLEISSISFPIGMITISILTSFLNCFLFCTFIHFIVQLVLSIMISIVLTIYNQRFHIVHSSVSVLSLLLITLWSVIFCFLSTKVMPSKDSFVRTAGNDMLLEISMISSFTRGVNFKSSIFSGFQINILKGLRTRTEILPFLYSSLIKASGCSLQISILIPTMLLFTSICFLSFSYTYKITNNQFISFFAAPTIFFIGGLGFMHFISNNRKYNGETDYIFYLGYGINNWGHPLLHNFLTSRINLASLSLSLITYLLLESGFYHLAGLTSIISFFVRPQSGFILFIAFFLYNIDFKNAKDHSRATTINKLIYYIIPFLILSFLFLKKFSIEINNPLWKSDLSKRSFIPFLSFAFHIYGFGFLSIIFAGLYSPYRVILSLFLFYFLGVINLQTEHRFNFFTSQTVVTPLIVAAICSGFASFLKKLKNQDLKGITVSVYFYLFIFMWLSTFCGLYNQLNKSVQVFDAGLNEAVDWIVNHSKSGSVFAMPSGFTWNPAFTLAGRVGYVGNLQALQDYRVDVSSCAKKLAEFVQKPDHRIDADYFIFRNEPNGWRRSLLNSEVLNVVFNNSKLIIMSWKPSLD